MVPGPVSCVGIPWFWQSFFKAQRVEETLHYYSSIMLDSFASLLCSKLCRHNVDNPTKDEHYEVQGLHEKSFVVNPFTNDT